MKQECFHYEQYPSEVAEYIRKLLIKGYKIVSMTSIASGSNNHMMEVIIIAEKNSK
jgi:hypothetical protein